MRQSFAELVDTLPAEKKISSDATHLLLFLKKNPKIIAMLHDLFPQAILVGFKLLVGTSKQELIQAGQSILLNNHCDFVFANDLEMIQGDQHLGYLLDSKGVVGTAKTKTAIAQLIVAAVEKKGGNR